VEPSAIMQPEVLRLLKTSVNPLGIEPATFRPSNAVAERTEPPRALKRVCNFDNPVWIRKTN